MKKLKNILSITLCFMLVVGSALLAPSVVSAAGLTASELYVRQMGTGKLNSLIPGSYLQLTDSL